MRCAACGFDNPSGFRYCGSCGATLAETCPSCGAEVPQGFRFCGACGRPVKPAETAPARQPPVAETLVTPRASERRLVSVLFADLVGFTTLSEKRDPEEVRELLTRYFDISRTVIERYGGTVEKFIGDAVMAVWGTPTAHEDDAERAVRAGLELVDAVSALGSETGEPRLKLRAGVLSGEAAVTFAATGQGMVAGDLVNTASRLQSAASPGTVLVGATTYAAAKNAIAFGRPQAHTVKGKELPVAAWQALRVVAGTGGFRRVEGLEVPFVGRDDELRFIKEMFHATERERRPRLVSVVGVGGIGKSRLAWEFFKYLDGVVGLVHWHQGRCPSYGEGVTFWALGEMVRMRARIAETEDEESSREKLTTAVAEYVGDPDERRWIEPRLADLLGLGSDGASEKEELFAAWRTFFERISERAPVVLVFEDLQWADHGLIDFIEHLLEWARSHPILIVTLARPELLDRRPTWGAGQRNFASLQLEPLPEEQMRKLISGVVSGLSDHLVDHIASRSDGVPLYGVEMVRMLIDQGVVVAEEGVFELARPLDRLEVPDTLHSLIASRLDALSAEDRALVQDAAVLGQSFTIEGLEAVTGRPPEQLRDSIDGLTRAQVLQLETDPRSPERGQYGFVQSLIREVAYSTLARAERKDRHLKAARFFETLENNELATVVASHYMEAYDASARGPEAEALMEAARRCLVDAAERAESLGAYAQALTHLEAALKVAPDDDTRAQLWERAGDNAEKVAALEVAEDYLRRALDSYRRRGDTAAVTRCTSLLGSVLTSSGKIEEAIHLLESEMPEGELASDPSAVRLAGGLAFAHFMNLDTERCLFWAEKTLLAAEHLGLVGLVATTLSAKAATLLTAGRSNESIATFTGALALAEESDLPPREYLNQLNTFAEFLGVASPAKSVARARDGLDESRRLGLRFIELSFAEKICWNALHTGEWDFAAALFADVYSPDWPAVWRMWLGLADAVLQAYRGKWDAATARLNEVEPLGEDSDDAQDVAIMREAEASVSLARGELSNAYERAISAPDCLPAVRCRVLAARAALWAGDAARVHEALDLLKRKGPHTQWVDLNRQTIEAGLAALRGDADDAGVLYRDVDRGWEKLQVDFDRALAALDFLVLAPDRARGIEASTRARATLDRLNAMPFVSRLEAAIA